MSLEWTTTSQANANSGVKILVYAQSGIGKTLLSCTAPKPVIISAESGLLSLTKKNIERVWGVATPGITYDIPAIKIKTIEDLDQALALCKTNPQMREQFSTLCLDSLTEIAEVILNNAKRTSKDPRQAYGTLLERMTTIIREFRDIDGFHVYMAAKMEPVKDELSGIVKYMPAMPGSKLGPQLPYFFDEVLRLAVGKDQNSGQTFRYMQTQPDLQYEAKDRSGSLDAMEMPHLGHIFNKIQTA